MSDDKNLHIINVGINIWDEYSEKKNPSVYNNKSYHTYAYVESISEILNINGKEQHMK